jgi:ribose 5-phosphate isomerase RpiB
VWLTTAFDGGRHIRRREKVTDYEKAKACGS